VAKIRKVSPMKPLLVVLRLKLPFLVAGFLSFLFSVWLYFVKDETSAGIFVGLWVPSIHSLGTLLLTPVRTADTRQLERVGS
jgi:hypothetical protein